MKHDPVTDVPGTIVLRGYQVRSLIWAAGGGFWIGATAFMLVSDAHPGVVIFALGTAAVCFAVFLEAAVFNALTVTDDRVDHRWWLGLRRRGVVLEAIQRIGSRIPNEPNRHTPTMRIEWPGGLIEVTPELYDHRLVGRVLRRFIARGIPVDEMLYGFIRAFHPEELPPHPSARDRESIR